MIIIIITEFNYDNNVYVTILDILFIRWYALF